MLEIDTTKNTPAVPYYQESLSSRLLIGIFSLIGVVIILTGLIDVGSNFKASRTLGFIKNSLALFFVITLVRPSEIELKVGMLIGVYNVFLDYIVESLAYIMGWWYAIEGTIISPILIVPLEMILEFLPLGIAFVLLWNYPRSKRKSEIAMLQPIFTKKYFIHFWTVFIVVGSAIIGTFGDFYGANGSVWIPSAWLTPYHIFIVWASCAFSMVLLYKFLLNYFDPVKDQKSL